MENKDLIRKLNNERLRIEKEIEEIELVKKLNGEKLQIEKKIAALRIIDDVRKLDVIEVELISRMTPPVNNCIESGVIFKLGWDIAYNANKQNINIEVCEEMNKKYWNKRFYHDLLPILEDTVREIV